MKKFSGETWTISDLEEFWKVIDEVGQKWGITYPKTQIEILSADQMIETIATIGAPCSYDHWSIGRRAIELENEYNHGRSGLALELIINSDPTIMYIAENNSLMQQGLVMAHAGIGHGSVFKNNYLFKKWTEPGSILDYLSFGRQYIKDCEIKYGPLVVEQFLDMCHSLQDYSISHHKRKRLRDYKEKRELLLKEQQVVGTGMNNAAYKIGIDERLQELDYSLDNKQFMEFPEENIMYFIEKHSVNPYLQTWHKEIIRINRKIAEYFYPQTKTKILHEGWATFIEYQVFNELYNQKTIDEGGYLEFLRDHSSVIYQPAHDSPHYDGRLNPYAVGYAMFSDLYRMTHSPTKEDYREYPEICDTDWTKSLMEIVKNYSDSDFISKYLTPNVIRDFRLFAVDVSTKKGEINILDVAKDIDHIRDVFSDTLNANNYHPILTIQEIDEENRLIISVECMDGKKVDEKSLSELGLYIHILWGDQVVIAEDY